MTKLAILSMVWMFLIPAARADVFYQGPNPCVSPDAVIKTASGVTSVAGTMQGIVKGVAGKQIYVCSVSVQGVSGTSPTFALASGVDVSTTSADCAKTSASGTITPQFATVANTMINLLPTVVKVPSGTFNSALTYSLCYYQTGTSPVSNFIISYVTQ